MIKIEYEIIKSNIDIENQNITTYGIKCIKTEIKEIHDISTDEKLVQSIVDMMNKNHLDPIQFQEVCEDSLI